jgi:hypothetical protein
MKIKIFLGQMILFEVVNNSPFSKILFILGSYKFLAYLECVRIYAWSCGHSGPDLSSVGPNWFNF